MAEMTPIERVSAVVLGEHPDRPPVSFWHHFPPDCAYGQAAVEAHLKHLSRYSLDFLKVMNDNRYPTSRDVDTASDLRDLPLLGGDEEGYARQLELIKALAVELSGKVLIATTLFNAWAVLRRLVTPASSDRHGPPRLGGPTEPADERLAELLHEDRTAVAAALDVVAGSQANFARRCIEAGADGVFLSVRDDWVNTDANGMDTYNEMVRGRDRRILDAAANGRFNVLHVCGIPQDLRAFAQYPIHVLNWADRGGGPTIREVIGQVKPAICGGVDNLTTLPSGRPEDVEEEVRDALRQAGERPMMVSAGCTYHPDVVPAENLNAMVRAAHAHRSAA